MRDLKLQIENDLRKMVNELKQTNSTARAYKILCAARNLQELSDKYDIGVEFPSEYDYEISKFDESKYDLL